MRCVEGCVYDMQRGAWVACERCSGSGRVIVYLYPIGVCDHIEP